MNNNFNNNNQVTMFEMVMGFLTVFNTILNTNQTSNDELFKELQHQNKDYLENIVKGLKCIEGSVSDKSLELQNQSNNLYDLIIMKLNELERQNKEIKEQLEHLRNINL